MHSLQSYIVKLIALIFVSVSELQLILASSESSSPKTVISKSSHAKIVKYSYVWPVEVFSFYCVFGASTHEFFFSDIPGNLKFKLYCAQERNKTHVGPKTDYYYYTTGIHLKLVAADKTSSKIFLKFGFYILDISGKKLRSVGPGDIAESYTVGTDLYYGFAHRDILEYLLRDRRNRFGVDIYTSQENILTNITGPECLLRYDFIQYLLNDYVYRDVTISVKGTNFTVHRLILAYHSQYFAELFVNLNPNGLVFIDDIEIKTFRHIIKYIYTEEFDAIAYGFEDYLKASYLFMLKAYKIRLEIQITEHLNKDNAVELLLLAKKYKAIGLKDYIKNFIQEIAKSLDRESWNLIVTQLIESKCLDLII